MIVINIIRYSLHRFVPLVSNLWFSWFHTDQSASELASLLERCNVDMLSRAFATITSLHLRPQKLSASAQRKLLDVLEGNASIVCIDLSGSGMSDSANAAALTAVLKRRNVVMQSVQIWVRRCGFVFVECGARCLVSGQISSLAQVPNLIDRELISLRQFIYHLRFWPHRSIFHRRQQKFIQCCNDATWMKLFAYLPASPVPST